jgi:cell filamentation protein
MPHDPYVYPGTDVLRNRWDLRDPDALAAREAEVTAYAIAQLARNPVRGDYDLAHLRATHARIFADAYHWAGEVRTVEISKGGDLFAHPRHVERYLDEVFARLADENRLHGLDRESFTDRLADYYADVNAAHPFREGNGRTQRAFLGQLAEQAGHDIAWSRVDQARNIEASRAALHGDNAPLRDLLRGALDVRQRDREPRPRDLPRRRDERDESDDRSR